MSIVLGKVFTGCIVGIFHFSLEDTPLLPLQNLTKEKQDFKRSIMREKKFSEKDFPEITAREASAQISTQPELVDCLKCVICNTLMERVNYSYTSGIIIDRCRSGHGIWLDKDEIEKIQVFAERGEGRFDENLKKYAHQLTAARKITEAKQKEAINALRVSRFKPINRLFQKLAEKGFF
jgi:Zn-finger nucleic acid-binding protein